MLTPMELDLGPLLPDSQWVELIGIALGITTIAGAILTIVVAVLLIRHLLRR